MLSVFYMDVASNLSLLLLEVYKLHDDLKNSSSQTKKKSICEYGP